MHICFCSGVYGWINFIERRPQNEACDLISLSFSVSISFVRSLASVLLVDVFEIIEYLVQRIYVQTQNLFVRAIAEIRIFSMFGVFSSLFWHAI